MSKLVALVAAFLVACGTSASPSPTPSTPVPTATASPTTPAPRTSPPVATQDPGRADVLLKFAPGTNIADIDDVYDMITHLKNTPGIIDGFGDEGQITVVYDPRLINPEGIRRLLAEMGYPTNPL